jgi:hypothetical protein
MGRPLIKKAFAMNITKNIVCLDIIMIYASEANFLYFLSPFLGFGGCFAGCLALGDFFF